MNPWNAWRSSLGLASVCLAIVGCGGGDVPDPDADTNAAADRPAATAPAVAPAPAAPAVAQNEAPAAPAANPMPGAAANPMPAAAAAEEPVANAPAAAAETAAAPAEGEATADAARTKNSSATAEMLALGNRPVPVEAPATTTAAAPPVGPGPGGMMIPGAVQPGAGTQPGAESNAVMPAAAGGIPGDAVNPPATTGEMPGYPGGAEGGAPGGDNGPANFHSPLGAVNAFLKALKAKNPERLAEATARRAPTEASGPKNQKLFQSILEQSLTEDDLTDLANKLEGFQPVDHNQPKSSGRFSIILGKSGKNGEYYKRTITARHEKDGWKVLDISGMSTLKSFRMRGAPNRR